MNHKAIDVGATAFKKIDVPADWANAQDEPKDCRHRGHARSWSRWSRTLMMPVGRMDGDSLPVSAFMDHADGQFELGASAYEKRGLSVNVAAVEPREVHPMQPVLVRLPACHHPSVRNDARKRPPQRPRARSCWTARAAKAKGKNLTVHAGRFAAGLHGLRRVRGHVPQRVR